MIALWPTSARQIQRPLDLAASVLQYSAKRVIRSFSRSTCLCEVALRAACCSTCCRKASTCSDRRRCSLSHCADNLFKAAVNCRRLSERSDNRLYGNPANMGTCGR